MLVGERPPPEALAAAIPGAELALPDLAHQEVLPARYARDVDVTRLAKAGGPEANVAQSKRAILGRILELDLHRCVLATINHTAVGVLAVPLERDGRDDGIHGRQHLDSPARNFKDVL